MKKIEIIIVLTITFGLIKPVWAQKRNVESAAIYLNNLEMDEAKKAIDAAIVHEESKDELKTWYYYTAIYDTIYRSHEFAKLDKEAVEKFIVGCKKCVDLDLKKKYQDYCQKVAMINSAFAANNQAAECFSRKDYAGSMKFLNYVLQTIPYDIDKTLIKNNISEKGVTYDMAQIAIVSNNNPDAKKYLQKLIDLDYNSNIQYLYLSNIYLHEKDTARAIDIIELGRKKFTTDKDLMRQEIYLYQESGKMDVLLKKFDEAIDIAPDNILFLFSRATTYDNLSRNCASQMSHIKDSSNKLNNMAKIEKNPAAKTKLNNSIRTMGIEKDSLQKLASVYSQKAEGDYNKVLEINADYGDAYFNLGALTNNKTTEIVEKMNNLKLPTTEAYNKRYAEMKKGLDSILTVALKNFTKAFELSESMPESTKTEKADKVKNQISILYSIQLVYANLGDEKKTLETKMKRMLLELPGESKQDLIKTMGEPKNITKKPSDKGSIEVWTYDNLEVNMVNGIIQDVVEVKK